MFKFFILYDKNIYPLVVTNCLKDYDKIVNLIHKELDIQ